jgi:signal transduction histidine kinase
VAITFRSPGGAWDRGAWAFALLVVVMLLPAAFVLWFMNEAISTQAASTQQRVLEAYRGQLRLVRSRIDAHWREQAARLDGSGHAEARFLRLMQEGTADGAVFLDGDGLVEYPDRVRPGSAALTIEARLMAAERLDRATAKPAIDELATRLNDYSIPLAAAERLAFMERLRALSPNVPLPTQAALRLSIDLLAAERPAPEPEALRETALRDVWALTSHDDHVIALYRTGRLEAMMHDFLHQVTPAGVVFIATPPDVPASAEAIAAGSWLPGWQVTFEATDPTSFEDAGRTRRTEYISVALAGVAIVTIAGVVGGGMLRRHLHLARVKTDLVAAASHELRTPLTSMRLLVDNLLNDAVLDPKKTREYLEMMAIENARLSRLIENFLTFSRLERDQYRFDFTPVRPSDIVAAAVTAIRERLPAACDLRVDVEPGLPAVMADADALGTALINLLDNALKYTPADKRILVRARRDGGSFVAFAVEDNGIGIPIREQRRIFRRFYRVDQRLSQETTGVGLGLSIVELIARAHGGTVTVRSAPGAGSTFALRLPSAGAGAAA